MKRLQSLIAHPFCVIVLVLTCLSLGYLANDNFQRTGNIFSPEILAWFAEEPISPLSKVAQLQHLTENIGFPYDDDGEETIGIMFIWSPNMGTNGRNIATAAPRAIQEGELLHRTPDEYWKNKEGKLGPHNEALIHNEVEAIILPSEITATKGMPVVVKRHKSGFLFGNPAVAEEEVLALN